MILPPDILNSPDVQIAPPVELGALLEVNVPDIRLIVPLVAKIPPPLAAVLLVIVAPLIFTVPPGI